ncbi:MAG: triose-phosphate isomerase [Candidatus Methanomethylicus sp.]|nr:triose-phosphate isomerase [Candidatus Methanomethylicus sp.]
MAKPIKYPLILVNFKTYFESLGGRALLIAQECEKISEEYGICIAIAPQHLDIPVIAKATSVPLFSQHADWEVPGAHTGNITVESLIEGGAIGTILNHSEHRLRIDVIDATLARCKSLHLQTCLCANTSLIGRSLSILEPDMIAVEPPELIGSGISVSKAKPDVISESVRLIKELNKNVHILCGAGITTGEDVASSVKLGAEGVLVASGVVKAKNPRGILEEFAKSLTVQ